MTRFVPPRSLDRFGARPVALTALLLLLWQPGACAQPTPDAGTTDEDNTVSIVQQHGPSVAAIHVRVEGASPGPPGADEGGGSGFVIDGEGRIITNFHVVGSALEAGTTETAPTASITVSFLNRADEELPVRVLGANPDFDLALLEFVEPGDAPGVEPLPLGDSDFVEAGQKAIAIGSPFGLHSTVTTGIVSAIERERPGLVGIEIPFIQTDAAINPGNSGGPLLNSSGEVIGINNAILAAPAGPQAFVGVGFAVPSNLLRNSLDELLEGGLSGVAAAVTDLPDRPRIGLTAELTVDNYPPALRDELDLPDHGIVVTEVSEGGPADEAGLIGPTSVAVVSGRGFPTGGDIITGVNGQDISRLIDLQSVVLDREAGDEVTLTVWREGEEREVDVELQVVAP